MKTLLSEEQIRGGVRRLAERIAADYGRRPLTILGVMTGSVVLLADLIRLLEMPLRVGVVHASSYRGGARRQSLSIDAGMAPDIAGREVLIVDDIFDTGHTLAALADRLKSLAPASLRSAVLLEKLGRRETEYRPDYVAFEIPDVFVVGYGLDYQDEFRNLPFVAEFEPPEPSPVISPGAPRAAT
jgi:hypoxanthine phosphoribosyltransferase